MDQHELERGDGPIVLVLAPVRQALTLVPFPIQLNLSSSVNCITQLNS
jgi:hypothetical protein